MSKKDEQEVYRALNEISRVMRFLEDDKTRVLRRCDMRSLPNEMFGNKDGSFIGVAINKDIGSELAYLGAAKRVLERLVS